MKFLTLNKSSKFLPLLFLVFAIALALRVITVVHLDLKPESDYAGYQSMAINLLAGNGLTDGTNMAFLSAGYPLLVLAPVFALTGNSLLAAQLANALLGGISVLLCYFVARQAGAGRNGGLIASSLLAFYIPSWVYAEYLAKENLMTPLMLVAIWCALKLTKKASFSIAALCGITFGLLCLVGSAALAIAASVILALTLAKATWGRRLACLMLIILVAAATVSPWLARNYSVLGVPALNSNGGFNLYIGNNPSANGLFVSIADTPIGPEWKSIREEKGEMGASHMLGEKALEWMTSHPVTVANLSIKKAVFFWTPPVHTGKGEPSKAESASRLVWLTQFLLLALGSIGSIFFGRLRNKALVVMWSAIACYTAIHMLFYVVFRYREPIMPFLCVLTALALEQLGMRFLLRKSDHRRFFDPAP